MHTIRLTPLEEDTGTRLDSFLSRRVEGLTRSAAARLLQQSDGAPRFGKHGLQLCSV